jgi:hypothetical protein
MKQKDIVDKIEQFIEKEFSSVAEIDIRPDITQSVDGKILAHSNDVVVRFTVMK